MNVLVLGAGGQLGREMVRAVLARGHAVTAFVRRPASPELARPVRIHIGDAGNVRDLREALEGNEVVVNAIGSGTLRRNTVESSTTAAAVTASQEARVSRYFAMSAGMVAVKSGIFYHVIRPLIFRNIYAEHLRVERLVRASSLNATIVRPPRLTNNPSRGYITSLEQIPPVATTSREDVAAFVAREIEDGAFCNRAVFIWSRPPE